MKANNLVSTIQMKVIHMEILDGGPRIMGTNVLTIVSIGEISAMSQTGSRTFKVIITSVIGQEVLMDNNFIHT